MPENVVETIIQARLELKQAEQDWKAFRKQFEKSSAADLRKELEKYEDAIKQATKLTTKLTAAQTIQVKQWRANATAIKDNIKEVEAKEKADAAAAKVISPEQIQAVADAWEAQRAEVAKYITTVDQAKVEIQRTRDEIRALATSSIADADATKQTIAEKRQYLAVLQSLYGQLQQQERITKQVVRAQEQQADSVGKLAKRIFLWGVGSASIYYAYRRLRNAVQESIKDIYGETQQYKDLTDAATELRRTIVLSLVNYDDMLEFFDKLAGTINRASDAVADFSAQMAGHNAVLNSLIQQTGPFENYLSAFYKWVPAAKLGGKIGAAILEWAENQGLLNTKLGLSNTYLDAYAEQLDAIERGIQGAEDATDDYTNTIDKLVDHARRAAEAQREINTTFAQAQSVYQSAIAIAQGNLARDILQINIDLEKEIGDINQRALDDRAAAYDDYQDQVSKSQRQAQKQQEDDLARHQLEMEFALRRHQLTQIQNERIYQYERSRLVAEGDVLAIEDLDARYKLERQAAEENFQLQMEQAEALFRLQAKIQAEAMRDQIKMLQDALQKQLREIEKSRRERIDEAEAQAEEERRSAKESYADQLADAQAAYEDAKEEKRKAEQEQLKDTAEFLAELSRETGIGLDELLTVYQNRYGANGELVKLTQQTYNQITRETEFWTATITNLMQRAGQQSGAAFSAAFSAHLMLPSIIRGMTPTRTPINRTQIAGAERRYQYGGENIFSQPTTIGVGEGGPERVIVQPLTSLGGNYNVRLGGRAVIEGQGNFSGMDMAVVNATVNDAIQSAFTTFTRSRQNIRGKRGF